MGSAGLSARNERAEVTCYRPTDLYRSAAAIHCQLKAHGLDGDRLLLVLKSKQRLLPDARWCLGVDVARTFPVLQPHVCSLVCS